MSEDALWALVAGRREAVLATLAGDGRPQLSNVLYALDEDDPRLARVSTTADRAKARNLGRDGRAALHVSGDGFHTWAVVEASATLSPVAEVPGDETCRELLGVHSRFFGEQELPSFFDDMVAHRRLVLRLRLDHAYGMVRPPT